MCPSDVRQLLSNSCCDLICWCLLSASLYPQCHPCCCSWWIFVPSVISWSCFVAEWLCRELLTAGIVGAWTCGCRLKFCRKQDINQSSPGITLVAGKCLSCFNIFYTFLCREPPSLLQKAASPRAAAVRGTCQPQHGSNCSRHHRPSSATLLLNALALLLNTEQRKPDLG